MAIPVAKLLISAMAVFLLLSASFATKEVPSMLVHKKASLNRLKSGAEHVLVSIDIYNQGSSLVSSLPSALSYFRFESSTCTEIETGRNRTVFLFVCGCCLLAMFVERRLNDSMCKGVFMI